jgi:hypothetical protein
MMGRRAVGALIVIAAVGGCSRTFSGVAVQPNPLVDQNETLRESEKITIVRGDMELEAPQDPGPSQRVAVVNNSRYPLFNVAQFIMVSRDRLRFHVSLDHKWEEWADLSSWEVYLVDDKGHLFYPEAIEHARTNLITRMWDREVRSAQRNRFGDIVAINEDGWKNRQTLGNLSVFRGRADFVFYQRDLFTVNVRSLKLVVKRSGEAFEFTWRFQDSVASY